MEALVFDGKVVQIEARSFPVHETLQWIDIAGITPVPKVGWSHDGSEFSSPIVPPEPTPRVLPLNAEELYDILKIKGVVVAADRPRPKP